MKLIIVLCWSWAGAVSAQSCEQVLEDGQVEIQSLEQQLEVNAATVMDVEWARVNHIVQLYGLARGQCPGFLELFTSKPGLCAAYARSYETILGTHADRLRYGGMSQVDIAQERGRLNRGRMILAPVCVSVPDIALPG